MPIEGVSEGRPPIKTINARPETPPEDGTEYSFVVTPAGGDMAGYTLGITNTLSNEKGAPLSGSVSAESGSLNFNAFSFNGFEEDGGEQFPIKTAAVNVFVGSIQ